MTKNSYHIQFLKKPVKDIIEVLKSGPSPQLVAVQADLEKYTKEAEALAAPIGDPFKDASLPNTLYISRSKTSNFYKRYELHTLLRLSQRIQKLIIDHRLVEVKHDQNPDRYPRILLVNNMYLKHQMWPCQSTKLLKKMYIMAFVG